MKRNLNHLTGQKFDVLVIGGGITGVNIAWDATLRGLKVALVEKDDFGSATSANSLKTVHGGLRYLQDADLKLVRKMIGERQALLRIAPHIVRPLPVIMPTYRDKIVHSKLALGTAVKLNDLASFDRNKGMDPSRSLPNSRIFSFSQMGKYVPGLSNENITGGVMWYDAQVVNTERLLFSFVMSAAGAKAQIANYVEVNEFLQKEDRVIGVSATDKLTGDSLEIHADMVVNAAGPWVDGLLQTVAGNHAGPKFRLSTAMNLVTRQILPDAALGIKSYYMHPKADGSVEKRSRVLFVSPWREYSLVGTIHLPYEGGADDSWVTQKAINELVDEINLTYPRANLRYEEVYHVHRGFLPMLPNDADPMTVKLIREGQVFDHQAESGVSGLLTVVGVKYTTARYLAEKAVNKLFSKLNKPSPVCQTKTTPLYGGNIQQYHDFSAEAAQKKPVDMSAAQFDRLLLNYGTTYQQLLPYLAECPEWGQPVGGDTAVSSVEVIHAIRDEMAQTLSDVVLRRTEMGSAGKPSAETVKATALLMAAELGWDHKRVQQEIEDLENVYSVAQ